MYVCHFSNRGANTTKISSENLKCISLGPQRKTRQTWCKTPFLVVSSVRFSLHFAVLCTYSTTIKNKRLNWKKIMIATEQDKLEE